MAAEAWPAVLARLQQEGFSLKEQAAIEHLQAECGVAAAGYQQARQALLNADWRQVGAGCLPDDVSRADSKKLAGPLVLQVSSVLDISQPSRASGDSERKGRILRLRLTDGRAACTAVEFEPLGVPTEKLVPGTKVHLTNVSVRVGILLLEPRCLEVLGGRVELLAEAWEVQQQYGGTAVERTEAADADKPPSFRHFDPKLSKFGSRRGQVAAAKAAAAAAAAPGPSAAAAASSAGRGGPAGQQQQQQQWAPRGFQQTYQPPAARGGQQQQPEQQTAQRTAPQAQQRQGPGAGRGRGRGGFGQAAEQQAQQARDAQPAQPRAAAPAPAADAHHPPQQSAAVAAKLLGRLQVEEGRFGRGQRRGRRSRFDDDDEDDGSMTLEEWEAQQQARKRQGAAGGAQQGPGQGPGKGGQSGQQQQQQQLSDEELARQLQRQLDLEAAQEWGAQPPQQAAAGGDLQASLQSLFTYNRGSSEADEGGRGRGGRGRGRRGGGGGRGRGRGRY